MLEMPHVPGVVAAHPQVDDNFGDTNTLTTWLRGDDLVDGMAGNCSNTVVIAHTSGPIIMELWIDNLNATAVLIAGLPEQECGTGEETVLSPYSTYPISS